VVDYFVKKPKTVEAVHFDGSEGRALKLEAFCGDRISITRPLDGPAAVMLTTPSGAVVVNVGDFVVKGAEDDFYPVTAENFPKLFDPA
jgi:hypothetical protein